MFGLLWFGIFSAVASTVSSPTQLIVARGFMGLGGAFIFPTTLSILTNTFTEPRERARAIGVWAGVSGVGIALGPLLGGFLVERYGWGSVFLVNVPICTAALILSGFFVPNSSAREESPLDPLGALFSIAGLVGFLYGIIQGPDKGWTAPVVVASIGIGAVFLALFAWWEMHTPRPMLDVRFFKNPRFSAASATITITFFGFYASTFLLTQYFQFILRYSPLKAGVMIIPTAAGMMVGSPTAPRLVERFGTKWVVVSGLGLVCAATACYASNTLMSNVAVGLFVRLVIGVGFGITTAPVTESIMGSLPPSRAGVGSAVNDTTRQTGGALGVAVIGSVFAARYHAAIGKLAFLPAPVALRARESIGSSLQEAAKLSGPTGAHLAAVARHAYLSSMRLTYTVSVLIVLSAIGVAYKFLPARAPQMAGAGPYAETSGELAGIELAVERVAD
jgi:EmrB/QacA subfamily drug resistance transporter